MRLLVLFFAAIFCLAFDSSFGGIFTLRSLGSITPLAMPCLVVFVGLFAPSMMAYVTALLLGFLVDLSPGQSELTQGIHLIGPNTLGFFVSVILIVKIRNVVFRRKVFTVVILTAGCVVVTDAVEVFILIARSLMPWTPSLSGSEGISGLIKMLATAIYSGLLAVPLGWCLLSTIGMWRFATPTGRRATWR
ncbi:MAG: hypothetical protein HOC93_01955 [Phycisphaerae bacterium]|jgi:hypothetical protein|nr:hypothetical protein [Phycisphaerae bacterium]MDP7276835.1 hypothetical protein [Planctomycetaceae bacterium]HJN71552.1 hypothetical protein [Phycisphaerales bacterium]|tara:strand:- start:1017 stop:1589 length:573 start_codon:yes stop_codon:yes gene_type:complete